MVSEAEWHRVSRSGPGVPKRRGVPGRVSRSGPGVPEAEGRPGAGVLAEVDGERMAGMGLVTGTRALERGSRAWTSATAGHSEPGNVDV